MQGLMDVTALCSRDQVAQMDLWQLLLVQATGQAARVKMKEGERASFRLWQKGGTVRPFSQGTKVMGGLGGPRSLCYGARQFVLDSSLVSFRLRSTTAH